jgi:hypothetical protein
MCGGEGHKSEVLWVADEGDEAFQWAFDAKHCKTCKMLSATESLGYGRIKVTLKSLHREMLLHNCNNCEALSRAIKNLLSTPIRKPRRDSMFDMNEDSQQGVQDIRATGPADTTLDELEVYYQSDPSFECPYSMGGWSVRCSCEDQKCRHEDYRMNFDTFTLPGELSIYAFDI